MKVTFKRTLGTIEATITAETDEEGYHMAQALKAALNGRGSGMSLDRFLAELDKFGYGVDGEPKVTIKVGE